MHKSVTRDLIDKSISNHYSSKTFNYTGSDKEASFCIDNCPHKNENCKGTCKEFKKFERGFKKGEKQNDL